MSRGNVDSRFARLTPVPHDLLGAIYRDYGVWNEGGPSAMASGVWHPGIVWHDPPDFPDSAVHRGAMVVARHLSLRLDALGHGRVRVEGAWWVQEGQTVLVELSLHTGGQSSGVELNVPLFHIIRLTDGRAVEVWEYLDRHQALEAVRLRE